MFPGVHHCWEKRFGLRCTSRGATQGRCSGVSSRDRALHWESTLSSSTLLHPPCTRPPAQLQRTVPVPTNGKRVQIRYPTPGCSVSLCQASLCYLSTSLQPTTSLQKLPSGTPFTKTTALPGSPRCLNANIHNHRTSSSEQKTTNKEWVATPRSPPLPPPLQTSRLHKTPPWEATTRDLPLSSRKTHSNLWL